MINPLYTINEQDYFVSYVIHIEIPYKSFSELRLSPNVLDRLISKIEDAIKAKVLK